MKAKIGTLLMAIGYLMVAAAVVLFALNNIEQQNAAKSTDELMPKLIKEKTKDRRTSLILRKRMR